ncbi:MAG: delta-60 repeat domain-containing protein [Bacteroidia bacterium]|nr:delta-60 repeat domain-containing protein [Bacteroidia bacterium]
MKNSLFLACFMLILALTSKAQSGANDPTFNPSDQGFGLGDGTNGFVFATAIQSDGKIIIGGGFISYNATARNRIARLNDGSLDTTFNVGTGANNIVYATAIQSDGKIITGGGFTSYNGTAINRIARLNTEGNLDTTFNPGTGANNSIMATAMQSDGKIIIGGLFTSYNGTAISRIASLNTNGSLDTTFNVGTGANGNVYVTTIQSDGKIIIGGAFTTYNGTASNYLARLNTDGSLDTTFNTGTGANNTVRAIAIQSDGKIIIGGLFTSYNGTASNCIVRLNTDGNLDTTFVVGTGASNTVGAIAIQSDGKIIIGGNFTTYNGTISNYITRLNTDGSLDAAFIAGTGADNTVNATAIQNDGKIIIGGQFISYNGTAIYRIARLNADGSLDTAFNPSTGANNYINATSIQSDGKIIIGGGFSSYNGTVISRIARLNTDGSIDNSFLAGTGFIGNNINTIALQSDGKIIIGGDFSAYNGTAMNRLVRLNTDGSIDTTFNVGSGASANNVYAIAFQSDGKIIIVGDFATYNGIASKGIARLNTDGSLDATYSVGTGANASIRTAALQSDGKLIIGGNFTSYNGTAVNYITRLNTDGSLDITFNVGTGTNSVVLASAIQSDGKINIAGSFTSYNGTAINYIARLNTDGSLDVTFNTGTGADNSIWATTQQSDGKIIIGGQFISYNGTAINRLARLNSDGSLDTTFNVGTGPGGTVRAIAFQSDGKLIIGGYFTSYDGTGRNRVARILNCINTFSSITETACDSYTLNGQTYTASGTYTQTLTNAAGCDSVVTLHLTITVVNIPDANFKAALVANAFINTNFDGEIQCSEASIFSGSMDVMMFNISDWLLSN